MKRISLAAVALSVVAAPALAADLPQEAEQIVYEEAVVYETYDWNGAYVGANIGWGFLGANGKQNATGALDKNTDGVNVGVFGGYNFMVTPNVVLGAEADISYNDFTNKQGTTKLESDWNGTLRARAGYAMDRTMVYGTGGVAFANFKAHDNGFKDSTTAFGYTLGAGLEHAVTDRVLARVEYNYQDFGKQSFDLGANTSKIALDDHIVRAGVAVKF
ncbi:outer membrane protein [Pseudovibrio flavus]|uniref:outer membrane protein n=1 Tax=Pseudovibrio flavus TaxID=2529854 RepID=UPI0012BBD728|nr:outer membrane protein [Pseudovibrio flavus]